METSVSSGEVLDSLARFRTSDAQMHQRVRATTTLGENEMRILSYLLRQHRDGNVVKPSEISRHLAISSASTTALLDRLERQGSVERISYPTDRRSILIAPTARAAGDVADIVDAFETRVTEAIEALGDEGRASVLRFLDAVADAADDIATSER